MTLWQTDLRDHLRQRQLHQHIKGILFILAPTAAAKRHISLCGCAHPNYTERSVFSTASIVRDPKEVKDIGKVKNDKISGRQYTGSRIEPDISLYTEIGKTKTYRTKDTDYEIIGYYNNIKCGTATVLIRGINTYSRVKRMTFKITASDNKLIWSRAYQGSTAVTFFCHEGYRKILANRFNMISVVCRGVRAGVTG